MIAMAAMFSAAASAQTSLKVGTPAPEFSGASIEGGFYDLKQMRGKVVLLIFWSTRCEICKNEIPKLNQLKSKYEGRGVELLGLSMDNEDKLTAYLKRNPFNFHILPDSFGIVMQYADKDRSGNIDMGFPAYFLIDQNGVIAFRGNGWDQIDKLTSRLDSMTAQPTASAGSLAP